MPDLQNRSKFEAEFAGRLHDLSDRHLREYLRSLGDPRSTLNIPADFWSRVEVERRREQQEVLALLFYLVASNNGSNAHLARIHADSYAQQRSGELSRRYSLNAQQRAHNTLSTIPATASRREVGNALEKVFSPSRDTTTAVTEITRIDSVTRELDVAGSDGASTGPGPGGIQSRMIVWVTQCDGRVCNCCFPLHRIPISIHNYRPPFHPNCRCRLETNLEAILRMSDNCTRPTYGNCEGAFTRRAGYLAARKALFPGMST